jgi:hypothetical protein
MAREPLLLKALLPGSSRALRIDSKAISHTCNSADCDSAANAAASGLSTGRSYVERDSSGEIHVHSTDNVQWFEFRGDDRIRRRRTIGFNWKALGV